MNSTRVSNKCRQIMIDGLLLVMKNAHNYQRRSLLLPKLAWRICDIQSACKNAKL